MTLTHQSNKSTSNQVLRDLMQKRESVGVITLKEFVNKTGLSLEAAITFLKNKSYGDYINGRQGHPSRFVFGPAQDKWVHQELIRAEWRKTNGRDPLTGRLLTPLKTAAKRVVNASVERMIAVTVGTRTVKVPVSLEEVVA